jgi:hypothetical protein
VEAVDQPSLVVEGAAEVEVLQEVHGFVLALAEGVEVGDLLDAHYEERAEVVEEGVVVVPVEALDVLDEVEEVEEVVVVGHVRALEEEEEVVVVDLPGGLDYVAVAGVAVVAVAVVVAAAAAGAVAVVVAAVVACAAAGAAGAAADPVSAVALAVAVAAVGWPLAAGFESNVPEA